MSPVVANPASATIKKPNPMCIIGLGFICLKSFEQKSDRLHFTQEM